jgi:hypothetical protein
MKFNKAKRGGRPPKFAGPRRPVTVTLPESTLKRLEAVDPDRARAIVKIAESAMPESDGNRRLVDIVEVTPGVGVILVSPSFYLRRIPWLRLAEVSPRRFLLSMPTGTQMDSLELALVDLVDSVPSSEVRERSIIRELRQLIRDLRRRRKITKAEMLFIDTAMLFSCIVAV